MYVCMYIGIELKEGENGDLLIDEVIEDGSAFNDGFLTVSTNTISLYTHYTIIYTTHAHTLYTHTLYTHYSVTLL